MCFFVVCCGKIQPMPSDRKIDYLELPANDLDAVEAFYTATFGWTFTDYGPEYRAFERIDVGQDWFEVYRVADDVYAIYEPFQFQEIISYLIVGSHTALLFDSGMGIGRMRDVTAELTSLPVRVLASHSHLDHVGGHADFDYVYALDTAFSRTRARGLAHERVREEVAPQALCRPLPDGQDASTYVTRPFSPTQIVADGSTIDLGGRTLEVLHIPGHTPDSIALHDAAAGLLWTGDTYYEGPVWLFAPETDMDAYVASIDRLAALSGSLSDLLPAHNTPRAAPGRLVEMQQALRDVAGGDVAATRTEGEMLEYDRGGFSLILSRAALGQLQDTP